MQDSAIRHLAVCDQSPFVAAAFFEANIQIWSWKSGQQLSEFETILDFGGRRLILSPGGNICIAGSWKNGLAAHSVPDGKVLWHRKDIRQVQRVTVGASGQKLYCGVEKPLIFVIDIETGKTLGEIRGASTVIASQVGPDELVCKRGDRYLVRAGQENELQIPAISFGLHSAAFSISSVCLSEPRTGIRCIDLDSGTSIWHHEALSTNRLVFNSSDEEFYCVAVANTPPRKRSLVRLASDLLECKQILDLGPCWENAFSPSGELLITKDGDVWQTSTGKLLAHLDFPQRDYPDH